MQQTSWAWFFIFWSSKQQLIFHLNMFLKIDSRTHSGVFKINAHIPLLLFVLLPPIPNYNVDDFVLRGAGRRRVSRLHSALSCSTLWKGQGGRATTYLETWTCAFILKTPVPKITRINKKQPANMTALMQMQCGMTLCLCVLTCTRAKDEGSFLGHWRSAVCKNTVDVCCGTAPGVGYRSCMALNLPRFAGKRW